MALIDAKNLSVREINVQIRALLEQAVREIEVKNPGARHNLAVAVLKDIPIRFDGSVGYYCGGLGDGAHITVSGSAGWGLAESSLNGRCVVRGNAGNGAAAALRGGLVYIEGDASARAGVSMKGGTLVIGGDCGYMTGFMAQKGTIIVGGDAGAALGDSMYEAEIFVGGSCDDLGGDAVIHEPSEADLQMLESTLRPLEMDANRDWKKVVSGRQLWTFDKRSDLWRAAL